MGGKRGEILHLASDRKAAAMRNRRKERKVQGWKKESRESSTTTFAD